MRTLPFKLLKETSARWAADDCLRLGASLAFYSLFSIFPLLLLLVTGLGFVLGGDDDTRMRILGSFNATSSPEGMKLLDDTLKSMQEHSTARGIGAIVSVVTLLLGASGVFGELDTAFNRFWRAPKVTSDGIWKSALYVVKEKAASLALVVGAGLLVLSSVITSTVLGAVGKSFESVIPFVWAWDIVEVVVSGAFLVVTFAAMFRVLPQTHVAWRDVGWGALLTAVLFTIAKRLLTWYLSHLGSYAAYGAVGAVLGLLMWIYLASQIVYFGAEFTRVYAEMCGSLREGEDARREVEAKRKDPNDGAHAHPLS